MSNNNIISYCYVLSSCQTGRTYNGYTTNLKRRLRQHNGEIKGGARATQSHRPHEFLVIVTSPQTDLFTKNTALSLEWHIRYPTNKRPRPKEFNCNVGRINAIPLVLSNPKFAIIDSWDVYVHDNYKDYLTAALSGHDIAAQVNVMSLNDAFT